MKFKIALIVSLLVIISVIVTLNLFFHQSYESEMAAQINKQQLIIAKTIANTIEDTLEHFEEETVSLAGLFSLRGLQSEGLREYLKFALAELQEDIHLDIILMDEKGRHVYSNIKGYKHTDENSMLFDVARRLEAGKTYLHDSTGEERKLKLATPIRSGGRLLGVILLVIDIDGMNDKYIAPVRSGQRGYAWIMNSYGTLVYHPMQSDMIGKNIFENEEYCYRCHKSFNAEIQILNSTEVGFSSYIAPLGEDKLIAFSRVTPVEWIVCVSIPYSEVTASINTSMRLHSMLVLSIFISTVVGAFIIIVINRERVEAESRAGYADKIREYAHELENIVNERTDELRSEKEKLDAVIGSIEAGICIFDEAARCVWMNKVMNDWLSDEVREGFSLDTLSRDLSLTRNVWDAIVEDKLIQELAQLDLGRKKGYFQMAITPLHTPGHKLQLLFLLQDVTELKTAEEKLIQSDKLAALSRLSAGVAHEIGNPLTSISSYVQILRDMDLDGFTKEALETVSKHIERIAAIVKRMSSYSKTRDDEIRSFSIPELIGTTIDLIKYDMKTRNVDISVDLGNDLPPIVVNGNQMIQIFINLVMNATDAMPEGGRLDITTRRHDGDVEIVFRDTGAGIEKEHLDRIFEPFFTTKERGTGLGLSVSYSIIKSFGGDITVESAPGGGSTFKVRLPVHEG
jgi:C4-dicarboxylate-specific signal transduction histidine kinase